MNAGRTSLNSLLKGQICHVPPHTTDRLLPSKCMSLTRLIPHLPTTKHKTHTTTPTTAGVPGAPAQARRRRRLGAPPAPAGELIDVHTYTCVYGSMYRAHTAVEQLDCMWMQGSSLLGAYHTYTHLSTPPHTYIFQQTHTHSPSTHHPPPTH